ncbi:glycosyltransferase [Desulfobulbus alkaliphilus]|uniref:glycosyltransferase n=1 Tax=Desulfobulbus alkaliphilus TaxID=869814 RepID=UPI001964680D|nr:glycosyltransferase [Desulfobulbus alkaliphilus]MBM9538210.1 glycosyltransferase [Desulfobulbus alkaliphilus]
MSLKVLHIGPTPFFADRGCHIRIRNEIEALADSDVRIILCTYPLGEDVAGIDIRRPWTIPGYTKLDAGFSPYRFVADAYLFVLVLRTTWRERPDILHGHLHEGALIGWAVKWCLFWRRLPLIMDMQGSLSGELVGYGTIARRGLLAAAVTRLERLICRLPGFFFCSSEQSRHLLTTTFRVAEQRTQLLPDVVPDSFFQQGPGTGRARLGVADDVCVVVYAGSLLPGKGTQHVFEAIRSLHWRDDLFFLLLGYPVEEAEAFVGEHGLQGSVHLAGRIAYGELASWLAMADIALDPKEEVSGEASGKILHYMAAGLPVVCFDTTNNRSLLGESGYYAAPGSEAFTRAIEQAAVDREEGRRRGQAGRRVIQEHFSMAAVRETLLRSYVKLKAGG